MKLAYGFKCDYCGKYIDWFDKYSISYERCAKDTSYKICSSNKSVKVKALDLCENCFKRASINLESKVITNRKRHFRRLIDKYNKLYSKEIV